MVLVKKSLVWIAEAGEHSLPGALLPLLVILPARFVNGESWTGFVYSSRATAAC